MPIERKTIDDVIEAEREALGIAGEQPMALCLSGGGIRSATFSLGVLQGLAKLGRLRDFHYMSSVSGGSYIALWLATWIHRQKGGAMAVEEALKDSIGDSQSVQSIKRLRAYSNFLSPVHGLSADSVSIAAICMRNLLLHWTMVLPLVFALLLLPRAMYSMLSDSTSMAIAQTKIVADILWAFTGVCFFGAIVFASWDTSRVVPSRIDGSLKESRVGVFFLLPVVFGALAMVLVDPTGQRIDWLHYLFIVLAGAVIQCVGELSGRWLASLLGAQRRPKPNAAEHMLLGVASALTGMVATAAVLIALYGARRFLPDVAQRTTMSLPLVLGALAFSNVVRAGFSRRWTDEDVREWWGRASGIVGAIALAWLALSMVVIQVPTWLLRWASSWSGWAAGVAGVGSIALTVVTTIVGYWSKHGPDVKEKAMGLGRFLGLRAMEVAAGASMLVIAVSASLLLGVVVSRSPFLPMEVQVSDWEACQEPVDPAPRNGVGLCLHSRAKSIAKARNIIESKETCAVLIGMASTKPDTYCGKAQAVCPASSPPPVACTLVGKTTSPESTTASETAKQAKSGLSTELPATKEQSKKDSKVQPQSQTEDAASVSGAEKSEEVTHQIMSNNFALVWLSRHEASLLGTWHAMLLLAAALVLVGRGASFLFGANAFSLNSFYGNRLTRAYLGASRELADQHPHPFTGFDKDDNLSLENLAPVVPSGEAQSNERPEERVCLLPVVNTALNLICPSGDRLEWQERKAASFFMSPYYCGSEYLSFVPTKVYGGGMSVGRAMAISGAAASPSMGYHSSPLVTMLMAFFNVRLGWWMPNPDDDAALALSEPPYGIGPIMSEMFSKVGGKTPFVYLSDGGHFENLGLYEMVRRRCSRILVVDATCDPEYQYEDLEDSIRKIRVDLGFRITFDGGLLNPERARDTGHHYCSGKIHYRERDPSLMDGEIVYIKPVLSGNESLDVRRYAESTRSDGRVFPQQSTEDQFFDEAQFESYRELGLHSLLETFGENSWPDFVVFKANSVSTTAASEESPRQAPLPKWAPSEAPKPSGGMFAALASLGPLGQAAMVASITAAVTVTGTVALKDPTVTLSNPKLTLDAKDLHLTTDPSDAIAVKFADSTNVGAVMREVQTYMESGNDADVSARARFGKEMKDLLQEAQLNVKLIGGNAPGGDGKGGGTPVDVSKLADIVSSLGTSVDNLNVATAAMKGTAGPLQRSLTETVRALQTAVEGLNSGTTTLSEDLRNIENILRTIDATVKKISPRETVKGSGS